MDKLINKVCCWFCGEKLKKKESIQVCKICHRETKVWSEEGGEYVTCKCCEDGEVWTPNGKKEWWYEAADFNDYLDSRIPKNVTTKEVNKLSNESCFISACAYGGQEKLFDGEVGKLIGQRLIMNFNKEKYLKLVKTEWNKRDENKKYLITEKDL